MSLSRDETVRLMVMNDTQWKEASYLQDLLSTLKQREANLDAKDVKGERTGYFYAALAMFTFTFHSTTEPYYDKKRKCLWHLGWRGPKQPESPELEIRKTYYIVRESRYLCVYADRKQHSKWIARFDMLNPEHRQSFVMCGGVLQRNTRRQVRAKGQKLGENSGDAWLAPEAQKFGESSGDAWTSKYRRIDTGSAEDEPGNTSADT